jgi:hypothetical protein
VRSSEVVVLVATILLLAALLWGLSIQAGDEPVCHISGAFWPICAEAGVVVHPEDMR